MTGPTPSTTPSSGIPLPVRLDRGQVTPAMVEALSSGALVSLAPANVIELAGAGAVTCLQGLLTNDIEKPGDGGFVYGALLTPKGMVVVDAWVARHGTAVRCTVPTAGRERAMSLFTRSIPPRLARVIDHGAEVSVLRLCGPTALATADAARLPIPEGPSRAIDAVADGRPVHVARASEGAPFTLQYSGAPATVSLLHDHLVAAGAFAANPTALELARMLAGWPGLASEVDDKTLPQEIRFDEIGGVSYTKGCYTGQETVSRVHFRGHPNRGLAGVRIAGEPPAGQALPVTLGDREIGRVTSVAWIPEMLTGPGEWVGLAMLRRDVAPGTAVRVSMIEAHVAPLPLALSRRELA
jgi:tRNA-modifying protein YgfZ